MVNKLIREDHHSRISAGIPLEEARKMGAMALFGEKYGEKVRVVEFGNSVELCGGTHVSSTGRIGILKIVSEGAIAAGIRRIEAVTASKAEEYINEKIAVVDEITSMLKTTGSITDAVSKLISENGSLKKQLEKLQVQSATSAFNEIYSKARDINGIKFISGKIENASADTLKNVAFHSRTSDTGIIVVLGSEADGKANLVVAVSDDLVKERTINAAAIIKDISPEIKGGGGGQPFLATAGGKNPAGIDAAIRKAEEYIRNL
jgi:alanyl-tRNA synthetase